MKTQSTVYLITALAALIAGSATDSEAITIFDNFEPGDGFNAAIGWEASGPAYPIGEIDHALAFVPGADFYLDSVEVALWNGAGTTDVHVRIAADDGSRLPQTTWLDEIVVTAPPVSSPAVVSADFDDSLLLSAGDTYWIWLSAPSTGLSAWSFSSADSVSTLATSRPGPGIDSSGSWSFETRLNRPAMRVTGIPISNAVPEPGYGMALLGLSGVAVIRRRRRD